MLAAPRELVGIHHVSALSAHIARSRDFYVRVLGMRPIVTTVNQDDPRMYHLFFGDGAGSTGSGMTIVHMPLAAREHRGHGSVSRTAFRIPGGSLAYWSDRLTARDVPHEASAARDDRLVIDLEDFEGTRLSLVSEESGSEGFPWSESPVPPEHQILGLGYTTITVRSLEPTHLFLTDALKLSASHTYPATPDAEFLTHVYTMGAGGVHAEIHVAVRSDLPRARYGAGGVHHVALRVPHQRDISAWADDLHANGHVNSGVVDRHWFQSVYVREPNHVLFELATDDPGFNPDDMTDRDRLVLPAFLEPRRAEIEAALIPLTEPGVA